MFDFITREMISFLSLVHGWSGSWGWAIVALTLVVRLVIFPLSMKQFASMRDMQRIQPKMKELQAKYKDQPQVMNQELMKLYQDHKVNPFGGCLPLLVQMPFLIALYSALIGDEFKKLVQHGGFGPIADLTRVGFTTPWNPPMLFPTSFIDSVSMGLLHLDAVVLVVLFGVTTYVTQRISMTDPNDPMQKQMLTMMPIMITFMFVLIPLPAGVLLYTVVSNFFTMGQYLVLKRMYPSDPVPAVPAAQATIDVAARP